MGVYVRFFSASPEPVSLHALREHLLQSGGQLDCAVDQDAAGIGRGVVSAEGLELAAIEANTGEDALAERDELLEELGRRWRPAARRVRSTLQAARQVVGAQILHAGRTDEGWELLAPAIDWLVASTGPIWQADEAGYYEGGRLILRQR